MNALLAQFIPEARDLLEQAGAGMLALEQDANSQSVINDVFRAVHTLKGSSGLFDVAPLTRLVHAAEDLLGEVRTGELALNSDIVDRLLDSLDVVGRWIDSLEAREQLPGDAEATMTERVAVLRSWLAHTAAGSLAKTPAGSDAPPAWLVDLPEADRIAAFTAVAGRRLLAWSFDPEEDCFFRGDDPIAMLHHSPGMLAFRATPREPFPAFDALDPLACLLRFEVLSDAPREALEEHMRYVADRIDVREIAPRDLAIPTGAVAKAPVFRDFARLARQHLEACNREALDRSIDTLLGMVAPTSIQASALRWCNAHIACLGLDRSEDIERLISLVETGIAPTAPARGASENSDSRSSPAPNSAADPGHRDLAHRIALEQIKVLETGADPGTTRGRLESVAAVMKSLLHAVGGGVDAEVEAAAALFEKTSDLGPLRALAASLGSGAPGNDRRENVETPILVAAAPPPPPIPAQAPSAADNKSIPRVLRVDQSKIDSIMNLVAELIVAKNGLSYLATRAEQVHGSRAVAREIKDQFAVIDRITQGLQVGVMSVRMMPVSQVFQRFPRLVRDISRKLSKSIELVIEGEDTEADKNVLESLADPLIHMVRNSLDHGIETPEDRIAAGKPEKGVLRITARHENDFVVIEVSDDGKGIDPRRVKAKALQTGLISAERAEQMSDQDAANLVFAAGFSTNEEVSDLSGRGVGMDVVRSAVLKAGGDVSLRTTLGVGTSVTVRLPLTMAVTRIVTIDCRGRIFGIPMDLVVETVKITRDRIHRFKDMETFVLRDAIIPIVRLARSLRFPDDAERREEESVMVVRVGDDRIGMVVDGFRERLEVIVKPLEGVLEGMPGFSGTALLGDGRVLLILDLKEML
jgi:two-component system, chemotaxis family, sensor kinase CheA